MKLYKQVYTRENCLMAMEIWEEHSGKLLRKKLERNAALSLFDSYEGVVKVFYDVNTVDIWHKLILKKSKQNSRFVAETMKEYGKNLDKLEYIWHKKKSLDSAQELKEFFDLSVLAWVGLSISYFLPGIKNASKQDQNLGMALRKRSADFLEYTDHVIQKTLQRFYPKLKNLVKYISIHEIINGKLPSEKVLKNRQRHYIYYNFQIITNLSIKEFLKKNKIEILEEKINSKTSHLKGQVAMEGSVIGKARILYNKSQISALNKNEILITAMTTPDYLPAMHKASGFVTDEGGVTCHAAIVARELKKPCIIGTKFATRIFKTGDLVEVDANKGIVRKIK